MQDHNLKADAPDVTAPRVLLTDTDRRPYAARLALELAEAGCEVAAICSAYGHPLLKTHVVGRTYSYSPFRPLDSLSRAIQEFQPDVVIPCDDRGVRHLHELFAGANRRSAYGKKLADLIERSLGSPQSFSIVSSRYDLLRIAGEEGLQVPRTRLIQTKYDLSEWQKEQRFPWVLKADETWGGRGVRIVGTSEDSERLFLEVSNPFRLHRAIKRMVVNRDSFWFRPWWDDCKPAVIVQAHIQGRPANCGVLCSEGKVLAGIAVEVVNADGFTGPASVVRVVDNSKMMYCADRIASRLGLSGFFGLDFMIEDVSGDPYLIEMNPRCTPVSHLRLGEDRDMIGALWGQLNGQPSPRVPAVTENDMIAYFPQAWNCKSELLQSCFQDIPQGQPDLIKELLQPWPERSLLFRIAHRIHRAKELAVTNLDVTRPA